jgi:hypothetical protein
LLFPAEQRNLEAQLEYLQKLSPEDFKKLFAPLAAIESRMDLPRWDPASSGLSINDTGILARSPLYPQWRTEVEKVFAQIDGAALQAVERFPRLLVCALPAGLPLSSQPLWPELAKHGKWVSLDQPFGKLFPNLAAAIAGRGLPSGLEPVESTWVFDCENKLASLAESSPATVLSWNSLATVRREFLSRLNTIKRTLNSVDQTNEDLRRIDLGPLLGADLASKPRIREFVRTLLLSGNGSLVFGNSFVQWGAAEALRRAEPQALFACFCIRAKLKPFSSSVLFEDQSRSNPVPDQDDPAGSLVDAMMLANYVYLSAQRLTAYEGRTLTLMAAPELNRILVLSPKPVPDSLGGDAAVKFALDWLAVRPPAQGRLAPAISRTP